MVEAGGVNPPRRAEGPARGSNHVVSLESARSKLGLAIGPTYRLPRHTGLDQVPHTSADCALSRVQLEKLRVLRRKPIHAIRDFDRRLVGRDDYIPRHDHGEPGRIILGHSGGANTP